MEFKINAIKELQHNLFRYFKDATAGQQCNHNHDADDPCKELTETFTNHLFARSEGVDDVNLFSLVERDSTSAEIAVNSLQPVSLCFDDQNTVGNASADLNVYNSTVIEEEDTRDVKPDELPVIEDVERYINLALEQVNPNGPIEICPIERNTDPKENYFYGSMEKICIVLEDSHDGIDIPSKQIDVNYPLQQFPVNNDDYFNNVQEQSYPDGMTQESNCLNYVFELEDVTSGRYVPGQIYNLIPDSKNHSLFSLQLASESANLIDQSLALEPSMIDAFSHPQDSIISYDDITNDLISQSAAVLTVNQPIENLSSENVPSQDSKMSLDECKDLICQADCSHTSFVIKPCHIPLQDIFLKKYPFKRRADCSWNNRKTDEPKVAKKLCAKRKSTAKRQEANGTFEPSSNSKKIKKRQPLKPNEAEQTTFSNPFIKDWLLASDLTALPTNDIDVNELLQDATIISSDIEDDAFQLAKYMEKGNCDITNILNNEQHANNSVSESYLHDANEQKETTCDGCNVALVPDQPLDLSTKQTTPISTDTGFSNGSSLIEQASSLLNSYHAIMNQLTVVENSSWITNNDNTPNTSKISNAVDKACDNCENQDIANISEVRSGHISISTDHCIRTEFQERSAKDISSQASTTDSCISTTLSIPTHITYSEPNDESNKQCEMLVMKITNNPSHSRVVTVTPGTINNETPPTVNVSTKPSSTLAPSNTESLQSTSIYRNFVQGAENIRKQQIMNLFLGPCFHHLNEKQCDRTCPFNHVLPSAEIVFQKIMNLSNDAVRYIYTTFVVKYKISFITYFEVMIKLLTIRKMESLLIEAIDLCEKWSMVEFFRFIFDGLVQFGLSKHDAIVRIIERCNKSLASINILLEIMIDTDALYFIDILNKCHQLGNVNLKLMVRLLQQVCDNPAPRLLHLFVDLLGRYIRSNVCDITTLQLLVLSVKNNIYSIGDIYLSQKYNEIVNDINFKI